jgi:hypothetical protein
VRETGAPSPGRAGAQSAAAPAVPRDDRVFPGDRVPADGALEELDGSPVGLPAIPSGRAAPALTWRQGFAAAAALTVRRPRLWVFALVPFLARGGLAVLVIPIVVAPTFVGLANFVGPTSVSAEGPGPRLVSLVALGVATGLALSIVGILVAAGAEVALHRATIEAPEAASVAIPGGAGTVARRDQAGVSGGPAATVAPPAHAGAPPAGAPVPPADGGAPRTGAGVPSAGAPPTGAGARIAFARVAALRVLLLVPVVAVAAAAVPAWIAVAYHELTVPSDVVAPLAVRVITGAPAASAAVLATWLAAEVVGGFATRRVALLGASIPRALGGGLLDPLRAPLGTALTVAAALGATLLVLAPAWWVVGAAWEAARLALAGRGDAPAALGAALLLAAAWLVALVLGAIAAAWRATLVTMELMRRRP